jgi:hypothetical protein
MENYKLYNKNKTELLDLFKNKESYNIDDELYDFEILEINNNLDLNSIKSLLDINIINSLINNNCITKSMSYYFLLKFACIIKNYEVALFIINKNKIEYDLYIYILEKCCNMENIDSIKFLLANVKFNKDTIDTEFALSCYNGKELSAKILYEEYNAYLDEEIFKMTCYYGFLNIAKWIYSLLNINLSNYTQIYLNENNELNKWLKDINPNIIINIIGNPNIIINIIDNQ